MNVSESFLVLSIREFQRLKALADGAVRQVSQEQFFLAEGGHDNSIAVIYKHMAGNMISRWTDFLTSDGEKPDRNRDDEVILTGADTFSTLSARWEKGWMTLIESLQQLSPDDVTRVVTIRGEGLSVLQAIGRQLTHYAYHVGQIVYLAKHHAGDNWGSLSIPPGQSAAFNKSPQKYVRK